MTLSVNQKKDAVLFICTLLRQGKNILVKQRVLNLKGVAGEGSIIKDAIAFTQPSKNMGLMPLNGKY